MKTLTTVEFESAVFALEPKIVVFDCDGTLWSGDAGSAFMRYTIDTGLLAPDAVAWLNQRYHLYLEGHIDELAICGEMVQVYAGQTEARMREAAAEFFSSQIEKNIFPELERLISTLQAAGTDIWAVSSTNDWVIEEGVRRFKLPANRVLAARVGTADGLITRTLLDVPTDQGKVAALYNVGITNPDCVFGNSVHDAHMLAIARRAFPVNPTPALLTRSHHERWPVYFPESVSMLSLPNAASSP